MVCRGRHYGEHAGGGGSGMNAIAYVLAAVWWIVLGAATIAVAVTLINGITGKYKHGG